MQLLRSGVAIDLALRTGEREKRKAINCLYILTSRETDVNERSSGSRIADLYSSPVEREGTLQSAFYELLIGFFKHTAYRRGGEISRNIRVAF